MCVEWAGEWEVAGQDIFAWKEFRKWHEYDGRWGMLMSCADSIGPYRYYSKFVPGARSSQDCLFERGTLIEYPVGEFIVDETEFGFFCYRFENPTADLSPLYSKALVLIPAGTMIRFGHSSVTEKATINAKKLKVLGVED